VPIASELLRPDYEEAQSVLGDLLVAALVVKTTLLTAANAADRWPPVEERDRLVMLALPVFDHQSVIGVVSVNWQPSSPSVLTGIAEQPFEPMLALAALAEDFVAEVDDVGLVTVIARHERSLTPTGRNGQLRGDVRRAYARGVLYALLSADSSVAVDVFTSLEAAEQARAEAVADVPEWENLLSVVALEWQSDGTCVN
jgi:hypothetical protein